MKCEQASTSSMRFSVDMLVRQVESTEGAEGLFCQNDGVAVDFVARFRCSLNNRRLDSVSFRGTNVLLALTVGIC